MRFSTKLNTKSFLQVKEPEGYGQKKTKGNAKPIVPATKGLIKGQKDIRSFTGNEMVNFKKPAVGGGAAKNIFGFGGTSFSVPSGSGMKLETKGQKRLFNRKLENNNFILDKQSTFK